MVHSDLEPIAIGICQAEGFTFEGRAGAGAFKQTFRVRHASHDLALKIYHPGHSVERAQREIDAMTRCDHPNIAKILRIATHTSVAGQFAFSLEEFLPGGTLTGRLATTGTYRREQLDELAVPLLSALVHLAALRLVHRDIKPDNVMLRQDGATPVIVDFGLVRDLSAVSITPSWAMHGPGTPLFASPEQLHNQKPMIDWRADQFSLGVVLSYCLLGSHPYCEAGDTPAQVVARVAARSGVSPGFRLAAQAAGIPVVAKMCAPWPYERVTRADALLAAWTQQ